MWVHWEVPWEWWALYSFAVYAVGRFILSYLFRRRR